MGPDLRGLSSDLFWSCTLRLDGRIEVTIAEWVKLPHMDNTVPDGARQRWPLEYSEGHVDDSSWGGCWQPRKVLNKKDCALALIVLSVEPSLLYLLGEPEDLVAVSKKLSDQFQKKSWANKLTLRRNLRPKEGDSAQEHICTMTELFKELAVVGDPVKEEDCVVSKFTRVLCHASHSSRSNFWCPKYHWATLVRGEKVEKSCMTCRD